MGKQHMFSKTFTELLMLYKYLQHTYCPSRNFPQENIPKAITKRASTKFPLKKDPILFSQTKQNEDRIPAASRSPSIL